MKNLNKEELVKLISENPELPIMCMGDSECVQDDGHGWWAAEKGTPKIDEYYVEDERIYLKSYDLEELVEKFIDSNYDEEPYVSMTEEELEEFAKQTVADYEWTKAIMLPIDPQ